jgi:retron-type reverse transcriptase
MPSWSDKLLQEVIRLLLEAYFEPTFSPHVHGFRPGRGCHTALGEVEQTWTGTKWFIEVRRVGACGIPVKDREG